jgi:hypothetical protein
MHQEQAKLPLVRARSTEPLLAAVHEAADVPSEAAAQPGIEVLAPAALAEEMEAETQVQSKFGS